MPGVLTVHGESSVCRGSSLERGTDIVLHLDEVDAGWVPEGAAADDHLDLDARLRVNRACRSTLACWLEAYREPLTVDGVPLPWLWEHELTASVLVRTLVAAAGLELAIARYEPDTISVPAGGGWAAEIARALAPDGVAVVADRDEPSGLEHPGHPIPSPSGWRRALAVVTSIGLPSHVRRGSVVLFAYWHLVPLVDRLLERGQPRVAVALEAVPGGRRRTLEAVVRGGFVSIPSRTAERRCAQRLGEILATLPSPPQTRPLDLPLDDVLHDRFVAYARERGPHHLALVETYRKAFRGRAGRVVLPNDHTPEARAALHAARVVGVPVLGVQNGVFLPADLEGRLGIDDDRFDCLEESDEVAVWSRHAAEALDNCDRPVHVVGYPVPTPIGDARYAPSGRGARVLVLVQHPGRITAMIGSRMAMRHSDVAIRAVTTAFDAPCITLRPHPGYPIEQLEALCNRHSGVDLEIDAVSDILALLDRHDVCIGARSTATYQAALVGVPVVVLNLVGRPWKWPLGGDTDVPTAESESELVSVLEDLAHCPAGTDPPGRASLLEALGGDIQEGALDRLVALVASPPRAAPDARTSAVAVESPPCAEL